MVHLDLAAFGVPEFFKGAMLKLLAEALLPLLALAALVHVVLDIHAGIGEKVHGEIITAQTATVIERKAVPGPEGTWAGNSFTVQVFFGREFGIFIHAIIDKLRFKAIVVIGQMDFVVRIQERSSHVGSLVGGDHFGVEARGGMGRYTSFDVDLATLLLVLLFLVERIKHRMDELVEWRVGAGGVIDERHVVFEDDGGSRSLSKEKSRESSQDSHVELHGGVELRTGAVEFEWLMEPCRVAAFRDCETKNWTSVNLLHD